MKKTTIEKIVLVVGALALVNSLAACGGGGGSSKKVPVTSGGISSGGIVPPNSCGVSGGASCGCVSCGPVIPPSTSPGTSPGTSSGTNPIASGGSVTSSGTTNSGTTSSGTTSSGTSLGQDTTDVNLQRGLANQDNVDARAQMAATQFQMNFDSARQLTVLADKMAILQQAGQLTDNDKSALARSALAVAGLQMQDVTGAIQQAANGDKNAIESVMQKGAATLGMPSTAMLRDQILPSLGIMVP